MIRFFYIVLITFFSVSQALYAGNDKEGVIILEGKYQERNIYIAQSLGDAGFGFCAYEIRVNGNLITDDINSSAFEIDLSPFDFKLGDDITIVIKHKSGCAPKILNPGGLKPKPTFKTVDIKIDDSQILEWITEGEFGVLPYKVQQYKWNKWVDVGEVEGEGTPNISNYAFHVEFTSGDNKFRVIQIDATGKIKKSKSISIDSDTPKLSYTIVKERKNKKVVFSAATGYEVHDKFGTLKLKGFDYQVDITSLISDDYWLSYDNTTVSIKR